MHKRHVENVVFVDMPEGIQPVGMVKVGVATEHLLHDALAVLVECRGETTGFANPILAGSGVRRSSTRRLIDSMGLRRGGHLVSWEHDWVMDLADNPFLNTVDEFGSRDLGSAAIHEPGIGQAREKKSVSSDNIVHHHVH